MELSLGGISVFIAIPVYGQMPADTAKAVLASWQECARHGVPVEIYMAQGSSRVTAARNLAAHQFLKSDKNRLFWIDSDMDWETDSFLRLLALSQKWPIIGASYPMRKDPPSYCVNGVEAGKPVQVNSFDCLMVDSFGLGFTCVARKVMEDLAAKAPQMIMADGDRTVAAEIFTSGSKMYKGELHDAGEDIRFFDDARELGYEVWMDPTIRMGHIGEKTYWGSFAEVIKDTTMPKDFRAGKGSEWTAVYNTVDADKRNEWLVNKLGTVGTNVCVRAPFFCELGENIHLGDNVFLNTNCTLSDVDFIFIGDRTLLGPGVQIYTGYHEKGRHNAHDTQCKPVNIGQRCWIGGNAIILPGVTIGDGAVVGAGSVVTKDVPADTTVAGNPARPIENDKAKED